MTEDQCVELERKARNCRDNARAEQAVNDAFIEEYQRGISGHPDASKETNARSHEIYDFTIRGQHRARDFLRDAELFEAAAAFGRTALLPQDGKVL
ncbi:hypothetical protein [Tardiphaga sp.]|uniref:hypothetical protein n=1 Tax=Tardiphaga sp. TaxID=1926292 RepID=UPI0026040867|nr:hypothetical protein [Tardiphaga sp.]MDB5616046.1 hypothetical protein [Tardiphaga sp.]